MSRSQEGVTDAGDGGFVGVATGVATGVADGDFAGGNGGVADGGNGGVATGVVAVGAIGGATGVADGGNGGVADGGIGGVAIEGGAIQDATGAGQPRQGSLLLRAVVQDKPFEEIYLLLESGQDADQDDNKGITSLMIASHKGDFKVVELLIRYRADVNRADIFGQTSLHYAAMNNLPPEPPAFPDTLTSFHLGWDINEDGNVDVMKLILQAGANVNQIDSDGRSALMIVAECGSTAGLILLLDNGANVNQTDINHVTALMLASQNGHVDAMKLLLEKGVGINRVDNNGNTALMLASQNGNIEAIKLLFDNWAIVNQNNTSGMNALMFASQNGHADAMKLLLEKGANIDQGNNIGMTALMLASQNGHVDAVKLLLEKKSYFNHIDDNLETALMLASQNGHVDAMKLLLEKGVNIDQGNNIGMTALMFASQNGHFDAVKLLLENGADVNLATRQLHWTPLMFAVGTNNRDVVEALINHGANINAKTNTNISVLSLAIPNPQIINREIIEVLLGYDIKFEGLDERTQTAIQDQTNKVINAVSFFGGNFSIDPKEINLIKLRNLCKKDGIPNHLLKISEENPNYQAYKEMMEKIKTSEEVLGNFLAEIYKSKDKESLSDEEKKTLDFYEKNEQLKPENFLKNDDFFKEKLALLTINPEIADQFFLSSKDWILPKEEHGVLNKLREEYSKNKSSFIDILSRGQGIDERISEVKEGVEELQQKIGILREDLLYLKNGIRKLLEERGEKPEIKNPETKKPKLENQEEPVTKLQGASAELVSQGSLDKGK